MALTQEQVLAFAVYEIRLLLSGHLGSDSTSESSVRIAAHLAYALHNQADAALHGGTFDPQTAAASLGAVDRMFGTNLQARLSDATEREA